MIIDNLLVLVLYIWYKIRNTVFMYCIMKAVFLQIFSDVGDCKQKSKKASSFEEAFLFKDINLICF